MKQVYRFTASWCQPCKMLARVLEDVETAVPINVIDIDENPDLAKQYGVRGVPTMVMVEDQQEVKRLVGMQSESALGTWLNG